MSRIKKERENHVNPVNPARPVAPGDGTGVEKVPPQAAKFLFFQTRGTSFEPVPELDLVLACHNKASYL